MTAFIEVGGLRLAYEDWGDPKGAPLLMVHGFTGHRDDFFCVREALAADRRVLIPDLRGHGASGRANSEQEYDFEHVVEDLEAFLDALAIDQVDVLGHSMGGMIALRWVLAFPTRVRSFIAMNTAPEATPSMKADGLMKARRLALEEGMALLEEVSRRAAQRSPDPVLEQWAERYWPRRRDRFLAMDPLAYAGFAQAMAKSSSLTSRLHEVRVPALVMVGEFDLDFLPAAALFETGLPNAHRVTLAGAGHHPHEENRAAWLSAVSEHFARVEG